MAKLASVAARTWTRVIIASSQTPMTYTRARQIPATTAGRGPLIRSARPAVKPTASHTGVVVNTVSTGLRTV